MIEKLDAVPEGFVKAEGVLTCPLGFVPYTNNKSFFSGKRVLVFVKEDL